MLGREIVVMAPVERVELTQHSDTIRAGGRGEFRARAFDRWGRTIDGAPIDVRFVSERHVTTADSSGRIWFTFRSAGVETIIASFGGKADTLAVTVVRPGQR